MIPITPATSIEVSISTGIKEERQFIYYLLRRLYRSKKIRWRQVGMLLKGGANEEKWKHDLRLINRKKKQKQYKNIKLKFLIKLKRRWDQLVREDKLMIGEWGENIDMRRIVVDTDKIKELGCTNRLIGIMRSGLAEATLENLDAGFVILDEFQKYQDLIIKPKRKEEKNTAEVIKNNIVKNEKVPVLLLSATPYKYNTDDSNEDNNEDDDNNGTNDWQEYSNFIALLDGYLLEGVKRDKESVKELFRNYRKELEERIKDEKELKKDKQLPSKVKLEKCLKQVMLRTERRMFAPAYKQRSILPAEPERIRKDDLREYFFLRDNIPDTFAGELVEYWKSGQNLLNFMRPKNKKGEGYEIISKLKRKKSRVFKDALKYSFVFSKKMVNNYKCLNITNLKLNRLLDLTCNALKKKNSLWISPCYPYYKYKNNDSADSSIEKYLVFSKNRFVPNMISMILSYQAECECKSKEKNYYKGKRVQPLLFLLKNKKPSSLALFNIFYPSLFLADSISPLKIREKTAGYTYKEVFRNVKKNLKCALEKMDCAKVGGKGGVKKNRLFEVMVKIDNEKYGIKNILRQIKLTKGGDRFKKYISEFYKVIDNEEPINISEQMLNNLTEIAIGSPAISLLRTMLGLYGNDKTKKQEIFISCFNVSVNALRSYFNKRMVHSIIQKAIKYGYRSYWEKIVHYCIEKHFQEVLDEYGYLVEQNEKWNEGENNFIKRIEQVFGVDDGIPTFYDAENKNQKSNFIRTHFAMSFGQSGSERAGKAGAAENVLSAFNSPFWPFVLSTTSIGQEGLDFHRYCRNVVHWNLPSSPVDMEQREGRINRYDCIAVRQNIAGNNKIEDILRTNEKDDRHENNLWRFIFKEYLVNVLFNIQNILNQGSSPHWLYEGRNKLELKGHVFLYNFSKDVEKNERLKNELACYRLAFGQPLHNNMMECLIKDVGDMERYKDYLTMHMIDLSPDFNKDIKQRISELSDKFLKVEDKVKLKELLEYAKKILKDAERYEKGISKKFNPVINRLRQWVSGKKVNQKAVRLSLESLLYFLDPFDEKCDYHKQGAFRDDVEFLERMEKRINKFKTKEIKGDNSTF